MKRLIMIILSVLAVWLGAGAQSAFFDKCDDMKDVTTVYISKAMLKMAKNINAGGDMNFAPVVNKISSIEIVTTENRKSIAEVRKLAGMFSTKNGYEQLVRVKDPEQRVTVFSKTGTPENEFIIVADEGESELSVIVIRGSLTVEDVTAVVEAGKK